MILDKVQAHKRKQQGQHTGLWSLCLELSLDHVSFQYHCILQEHALEQGAGAQAQTAGTACRVLAASSALPSA